MDNLNTKLNNWGQAQRALPENNTFLKTQVLEKSETGKHSKSFFSFPWHVLILPAFAVAALIIILPNISNFSSSKESVTSGLGTNSGSARLANNSLEQEAFTNELKVENYRGEGVSYDRPNIGSSGSANNQVSGDLSLESPGTSGQYYTKPTTEVPITDSREFLKTYYSSKIQSRKVIDLGSKAQTTIRGFGGRVDSYSASKESSYISFSLPASKLESFKAELKALAGERFYIETMRAENFLPQKQVIEQQEEQNQNQLKGLEAQKKQLTENHNKTIASLNSQIKSNSKSQAETQNSLQIYPMDAELQKKLQDLQKEKDSINRKIYAENSNYNNEIKYIDSQIGNLETQAENLQKQDIELVNKVETVNGTVYINRINWLEALNAYVPIYIILCLLIVFTGLYLVALRRPAIKIP